MLRKKTNGVANGPRLSHALAGVVGRAVDRRGFLIGSGLAAGGFAAASTVQPTAQWVQTDLTVLILPLGRATWASAILTIPNRIVEAAANPPAASPEPIRKPRRSTARPTTPATA